MEILNNYENTIEKTDTKKELSQLKKEVQKQSEYKEIWPILANDPDIKKATDKILAKELTGTEPEVLKNKTIGTYINTIIKKNPELWFFMQKEIGAQNITNKKYEQLTGSEKLKVLTLTKTINLGNSTLNNLIAPYKNKQGKIDIKKFTSAYKNIYQHTLEDIGNDFKWAQIGRFGNTKKTLKEKYKLTDNEANKFVRYLEEVKKQPNSTQEAWAWAYIFFTLVGVALWAAGMYAYHKITTPETQSVINTGRVNIWSPEIIAKLATIEVPYSTTWEIKKEQFKINNDDIQLIKWLKKTGNLAQNQEIIMEVSGKYQIQFDFHTSTFERDNATKKVYVHLKSPKIVITDFQPKILKKNGEVFEVRALDNTQLELMNNLKQEVMRQAQEKTDILQLSQQQMTRILGAIYGDAIINGWGVYHGIEVTVEGFPNGQLTIPTE